MNIQEILRILSIDIPAEISGALDNHFSKMEDKAPLFNRIREEELAGLIEYMRQFEVYAELVPVWTDDSSNYIGMYYKGPLAYRICYMNHEETDVSPGFRNINTFIAEIELNPEQDWYELNKDYPGGRNLAAEQLQEDLGSITELEQRLDDPALDDDLRCQYMYSLMALTPYGNLESLLPYLQDEDMYVQERACEIMGHHSYEPAKEGLKAVMEHGMHNGQQAAKRALARIRANTKPSSN